MAWDPPWDTAIHGSHAPGVGAGEPRASAATRRVEGAPAAAPADGYGPNLLGRAVEALEGLAEFAAGGAARDRDRKSTRLNSSHTVISYAVFCLKKKSRPVRCISRRCCDALAIDSPTRSASAS